MIAIPTEYTRASSTKDLFRSSARFPAQNEVLVAAAESEGAETGGAGKVRLAANTCEIH